MARPGDYVAHRAELTEHCCWMAQFDRALAVAAAQRYEDTSVGSLAGMAKEVDAELNRRGIGDRRQGAERRNR